MPNRGLLFIPDISGFTRFVNETEIDHSRVIIQELLELLINSNQLGLEVSEIEGDAILFYRFGDSPSMEELYRQVEKMFCNFHQQIIAYDQRRFCQCAACKSTIDLSLKIITHYGEFTGYNVKNFSKLIGKDIIVAHQLLKNDIPQHEYWLLTNHFTPLDPQAFPSWMEWNTSVKQTEAGEIAFRYAQLSHLKRTLPPEIMPRLELSRKKKMFSLSRNYESGFLALFHATGDFSYRSRWQEGVRSVEEIDHFLPRVGTRSRLVMTNGNETVFASSYAYLPPGRVEFSETNERKGDTTYFTMQRVDEKTIQLTVDYYLPRNFFRELLFTINRKKRMLAAMERSLDNLSVLLPEINIPDDETAP